MAALTRALGTGFRLRDVAEQGYGWVMMDGKYRAISSFSVSPVLFTSMPALVASASRPD
jgi:hypothetical protein